MPTLATLRSMVSVPPEALKAPAWAEPLVASSAAKAKVRPVAKEHPAGTALGVDGPRWMAPAVSWKGKDRVDWYVITAVGTVVRPGGSLSPGNGVQIDVVVD